MDVDQRVREILDRLNQDWRVRHRVADLAASVNLGPSRLTHLVRVHAQTSIRDFLRRRRIAEAARLLVTTHRRVSEISLEVGFTDACNFCHVFRRELGLSPREYRERERGRGQ